MADAQLMEEELQQSVMESEQEAELALDGVDEDVAMGDESVFASQSHIDVGASGTDGEDDHEMDNDDEQRNQYGDDDRSGSGSSEDDEDGDDDDDDAFEEDADGEEEDEVISRDRHARRRTAAASLDNNQEDGDDDEDEGVGAVKIKPGETDNEDDSSDDSASSASVSDAESDDGAEWEGAENDDGEDDESENTTGNCIFCKQDEDNDPAEEFEVFLACTKCGDNAHQQCARENNALASEDGPENWRCPKCADDESDLDLAADANGNAVDMEGIADTRTSPSARRASAPKLARDLLPSQKGAIKPDSHSVFNQLVLDGDPMDGSRVLRKRKTSSAEADENIMALRKRRKNAADDQSNDEAATRQDGSSRPVSGSLRLKIPNPPASIVERSDGTVLVKMRVNSSELRQILSRKPRPRKRSGRSGRRARRAEASRAPAVPLAPIATPFTSTAYSQPFYSLYDKETDELKGKPYGGILTEAEADTSKTMPTNEDRRRFDEAKQKAEEEWRERLLRAQSEVDVPAKRPRKASGPASQIECIQFGDYEIDTWYAAPYPEEYSRNRVLFICEFCLKYMNSDYVAWRHKLKCPAKHPPGDEIYRHGSVSVFEVDGRKNPVYCQNLCLLAKLFLGSKTLYYDVEPFLFYVLCEYNDLGYHFVGYFSKEKRASSQNNVSCILTLPIHQRKGYGNLLIDFSYLLTRVEKKTGSPEKPLSDMGLVSYRNYWRLVMCRYLLQQFPDGKPGKHGLSIRKISDDTGLTPDDVISALEGLRCLVRDPQTQLYAFRVDLQYCREYVAKWEAKNYVQLNESALTWTPYVMGRSSATNFELGPALTAIAPREEEEEQKPVVAAGESLANGTESSHQPDTPDQEVKDTADTMVLESTEPNDAGSAVNGDSKPNGILVNGNSIEQNDQPKPEQETAKIAGENWIMQYKDIPPTRFEVWPPITGSRRGDRSRGYIPRPPVVRTGDSASKPRPRRSTGSRRSTAARPKTSSSSSSKRKPGGTGRGPGRWPKGTKKSDYGNADSGPGFPPGWIAERARVAVLAAAKKEGNKENGGSDVKDTVQVQSPTVKEASKAQRGKENADVDMQDADGHAEDE